ncbi:rap guanine nucleotide exchange factor 4-like, partial [Cimex lectularius]|uniref:Cyclic nucleotide-binding domain-containing protein n=1 Tax=Cimex lectularius TaxID=79782 RepID=A0A8I6SRT0_CIMLE
MAATEWITAFDKRPSERTCRDVDLICGRLRRIDSLARIPQSLLNNLAHLAFYEDLEKGVTLFRQGEIGTSWYVILTGSVEVKVNQEK